MQKLRAAAADIQRVVARGERWIVVRREPFDGCVLVTLRGANAANSGRTVRLLTPFDRLQPIPVSDRLVVRSRRRVLGIAARATADAHEWLEPWSALTSQIEFLPWQFEPAIAAVSGATRLLLLDEVGLGKTIQAGLIVSELRARGLVSRALILTPASLRRQWATELRTRFGLDALVLDHEELARLAASLPVGINPWTAAEIVISSIDLVKRAEVRLAIDLAPLDMLVVDEAHHLTPGSDRGAVVEDLALRATWVVLATATPHSGDEGAFAFLSRIGAHTGEPPVSFRRRARDVGARVPRHVHLHRVRPRPLERDLLRETYDYARALWRQRVTSRAGESMVASVICRRAVSSSAALARTLARRRALLAGADGDLVEQPALPWLEDEDADGIAPDLVLAAVPLADRGAELAWLDRLVALAERVGRDSKVAVIERVLARTGEPAIIFSEYRDTLIEVERQLSSRFSIAMLHGALSGRERHRQIRRFVDGNARLLLASDVAGEGLNLQARCRLVLNIELPWNPVRLEQRIGRVDRLGQTRRVHAIHLCYRDSYEEHVLARLEQRIAAAAYDLQASTVDSEAIAAAVFDRAPLPTYAAAVTAAGSPGWPSTVAIARQKRAVARFARESTNADDGRGVTACAVTSDSNRLAGGIALLFGWDLRDAALRVVARRVTCIRVTFIRARRLHRRDVRRCVRELASCPPVRDALDRLRSSTLRQVDLDLRVTSDALDLRLGAIAAHLGRSQPAMFQGSLFDRRAEQRAQADRASLDSLRAHVLRQMSSARALRAGASSEPPRLLAAWPLCPDSTE